MTNSDLQAYIGKPVLVKSTLSSTWEVKVLKEIEEGSIYPYKTYGTYSTEIFKYCVPFEGNEKYVSTKDNAPIRDIINGRVEFNENYFVLLPTDEGFNVFVCIERNSPEDKEFYDSGNYFPTLKKAEECVKALNEACINIIKNSEKL